MPQKRPWGEGILRKPLTVLAALLLALVLAPAVFAEEGTTTDVRDADGTDIESLAHSDASGVVKYTVKTFSAVRADQVAEMRWDLDLDGDGAVSGSDDGCIVMRPVRGTRKLRAGILKGCRGSAFATADARAQGQVIKLRVLVEELEHAGMDDDAARYAYRFTSVDRSGISDSVPDAADALLTHTLSGRNTSERFEAAESTPTPTPTASTSPSPSASPKPSAKDTTSTGKADETTVEPGEDVDIEGGGFARHRGLKIFLVGNATSTATTATPTPTPTTSAAAQGTSLSKSRTSRTTSADVVVGQRVGGREVSRTVQGGSAAEPEVTAAAAASREQIGIAISDDDGNFADEAEIPDDTKVGTYRILVEGPNARGGTNTVTIPINVAAQVDNGASSSPAGDTPTNATGTATQASPVAAVASPGAALPQTGSNSLQRLFGLGLLALMLGAALLLAKRLSTRHPVLVTDASTGGRHPRMRLVFEIPQELRGEMQRLLARRTDRYDPDRHTDL